VAIRGFADSAPAPAADDGAGGERVTILWFVVWLIADLIGDREPLVFDPVNWWTGTLLAALAIDLNRPQVTGRGGK
jgi:hypothetical protein